MFETLSFSLLAFALFHISQASQLDRSLPELTVRSTAVLGPVSKLHILNGYIAPDGYNRSATLVDGVFPAPLIQANKTDQFSIQLINQLTDDTMPLETSVHWHGIFQRESNWADGAAFVTQCPLRSGKVFTARFNTTGQTGTYWYHSHYSTQYCDGLRGPLVIYDPEDPLAHLYDVDDASTVITLSDWYHLPSTVLNDVLGPVMPNSTLINGHGRYPGGPLVPLSVINVQSGLRYRFRLIGLSCHPLFNFSIDGHRMTIIEVDGTEVVPVEVDSIPILAGQRYSVIVTANQPPGNYWIRAPTNFAPTFEDNQNMATLRYEGVPDGDPTSEPGPYELSFDEGDLHPFINSGSPGVPEIGKADVNIQLALGANVNTGYQFNNVTFFNPTVPVLLQILSGARHPSELLPNGSVYELPRNKVIELSFLNSAHVPGYPHPMHLHGHSFAVVRVAGSNTTNFVNPVWRDVVSIGESPADNVTIRFVTDNPGPWFLHCHVDWHLYHGLAVVMAEAPREAAEQQAKVIPEDWKQLCQKD